MAIPTNVKSERLEWKWLTVSFMRDTDQFNRWRSWFFTNIYLYCRIYLKSSNFQDKFGLNY